MAIFNFKKREVECKIVYYGPGRCGKTTNMEYTFKTFKKQVIGEMVSIDTEGDRTLFFDFLPIGLGKIKGFDIKVQVYTVPGQVQYRSTRKLVLKGVDGVIFVADSQKARFDANLESIDNLEINLKEQGYNLQDIPYVLQLNKRDMPTALPEDYLARELRIKDEPVFPAVAPQGIGVFETLKACAKLVMRKLKKSP